MPGLCGFTIAPSCSVPPAAVLKRMQESLVYRPHHRCDRLFDDGSIAATRVHTGIVQREEQPFTNDEISIWLDGEFYSPSLSVKASAPDVLNTHYSRSNIHPFLHGLDGIFSAVIYDKKKQLLFLISDRYGLRHLYFSNNNGMLGWASEVKAFRHHPALSLDINPDRIAEFLRIGHLTGNTTWFDTIELLAPATVITWDLQTSSLLTRQEYWNWDEIKRKKDLNDSGSVAEALGAAFRKAVAKRCMPGERIGVGLSGGLDSRAIFAALPDFLEPISVFTFGKTGCNDIRIAQKVAALRPSHHIFQLINADNWFSNRLEAIWLTDGQFNMLHMHGIEQIDDYRNRFDIQLNGFLGDALLGGSYSSHPDGELARFRNRGRRFIAMGLSLDNIAVHTRIPFFDNELMELTMSIPLRYRRGSFIYNRMLLTTFPEFFQSIPWQKTGLPISATGLQWDIVRLLRKCCLKAQRMISFPPGDVGYTDYPDWIRREPARKFFSDVLTSKTALLHNFINARTIERRLSRHFSGADYSEVLGRYVTIEVWMRQFFEGGVREALGKRYIT
ncbi:MAG: hypothetical protein JW913_06810 [Chitinispirillaceae bacterium]|nr:hypothetical protein [Chitinispirillaceae bacterium]